MPPPIHRQIYNRFTEASLPPILARRNSYWMTEGIAGRQLLKRRGQTDLREWTYAQAYTTSKERAAELPKWLHRYNWHRTHGSIDHRSADSA